MRNPTCQKCPHINKRVSFLLQQRLRVNGGIHAQKEDKSAGEVIWENAGGRGKEQFKVGISQDRESLRGKACGQRVCGAR